MTLPACSTTSSSGGASGPAFRIVTGSENVTLEPIIQSFARAHHLKIDVSYEGSVSQMLDLSQGGHGIDAIWPSSDIWLTLGDTHHLVKYATSVMRSPVVLGVKKPIAERLGWTRHSVTVQDILNAAQSGKFRYMMTSATQSNSGASAYLGYLNAFAGHPTVLTAADLARPDIRRKVTSILGTINRSSGSSGWLEQLFLKDYGLYDGMVNYESVIIETNQQLVRQGRQPLYAVYPVDGLAIADYPLGYVDHGKRSKERTFKALQRYLLSSAAQKRIEALGRRTGSLGSGGGYNQTVFNPAWGIKANQVLQPIRFPAAPVIRRALNLYQEAFRKPSFTVYVLDYSDSMSGNGGEDHLKSAMRTLLTPRLAGTYFLQAGSRDRNVVIPFASSVMRTWTEQGSNPAALKALYSKINNLSTDGSTAIFSAVEHGYAELKRLGYEGYQPAIILMTDGQNNSGISRDSLESYLRRNHLTHVPVYGLMFGDADQSQLQPLADFTIGKLFDGRTDLVTAFRDAKGYND